MLKERDYQNLIVSYLLTKNGYLRGNNADFDKEYGIDVDKLKVFLEKTQSKTLKRLNKGDKTFSYVLSEIKQNIANKGLLDTLKKGVVIDNELFRMVYLKENNGDSHLKELYNSNILSVTEEVVYDKDGRVDLILFLNGLPIVTMELKCENSSQDYNDAIKQYKNTRDPQKNVFKFNSGALVHFAMDTNEVYMTTKLNWKDTKFLPFNLGRNGGAGNPQAQAGKLATSYMWEDVFSRDTIIRIIAKMVTLEIKNPKDRSEDIIIFPRYHQLDCIRKIEEDIFKHKTCQNYLIKHSTGSGKTNTIAWLSDLLSGLYYNSQDIMYDKIIIMTDRVVIDRQLQEAVISLVGKSKVKNITRSEELKASLVDSTRIIVCTIQKLSYIKDLFVTLKKSKFKRFAIIIDEAHQSTGGKLMENAKGLMEILSETIADSKNELSKNETRKRLLDNVKDSIKRRQVGTGKKDNISIFAFTATPKDITLNAFGTKDLDGNKRPFHTYSMTQAIEEGYIIDVLENYKCYKRYFTTNVKGDIGNKEAKVSQVRRKVFQHMNTSEENISAKLDIILDEFFAVTDSKIGGKAKAMVVTGSILEAIKYKRLIDSKLGDRLKELKRDEKEFKALVAFSNKEVGEGENAKKYREEQFNDIGNTSIESAFNTDEYRILIVANKFQTGFNQPLLHTMFVDRGLGGVSAVQTLSRLNRTCKDKEDTYVVDFVNDFKEIEKAFNYYAGHIKLQNEITPDGLLTMYNKVMQLNIFTENNIDEFVTKEGIGDINSSTLIIDSIINPMKEYNLSKLQLINKTLRKYCKWYEFVSVTFKIDELKYIKLEKIANVLIRRIQLLIRNKTDDIDISEYIEHSNIKIVEVDTGTDNSNGGSGNTNGDEDSQEKEPLKINLNTTVELPKERYNLLKLIIDDINLLTQYDLSDDEVDLLVDGIELVQSEEFKKRMETTIKNNPTSEIEETFNKNLKIKFSEHALDSHKYSKGKRLFNGQLGADVSKALYNAYMKLRNKVFKV